MTIGFYTAMRFLSLMYKLYKEVELYLPLGFKLKLSVQKRDRETLPPWMYELSDITGYKDPLPKHNFYLEDLAAGNTKAASGIGRKRPIASR